MHNQKPSSMSRSYTWARRYSKTTHRVPIIIVDNCGSSREDQQLIQGTSFSNRIVLVAHIQVLRVPKPD